MPVLVVADAADPRIANYANVPDAVLLAERDLFVAEGRIVVRRLLTESRFRPLSAMVTESALTSIAPVLAAGDDLPVYVVPQQVMNGITGLNLHRGCLALGARGAPLPLSAVATTGGIVVVLERVANPDNVGGVFRNAAAFGAAGVVVDATTTDPLYRKAIRTSVGTVLQVPFACVERSAVALKQLRDAGFTLVALTPSAEAVALPTCASFLRGSRIALVAGHEGEGLLPETLALCDILARIPIEPAVDSLNIAAAVAIALYEITNH